MDKRKVARFLAHPAYTATVMKCCANLNIAICSSYNLHILSIQLTLQNHGIVTCS